MVGSWVLAGGLDRGISGCDTARSRQLTFSVQLRGAHVCVGQVQSPRMPVLTIKRDIGQEQMASILQDHGLTVTRLFAWLSSSGNNVQLI